MSLLVNIWRSIPEGIRFPLLRVVQRNKPVYRWLMFRHTDMKDRANGKWDHLPPAEMRYRVGGSPDAEEFVRIGKTCANDIQAMGALFACQRQNVRVPDEISIIGFDDLPNPI